jgi:hypothetical protein
MRGVCTFSRALEFTSCGSVNNLGERIVLPYTGISIGSVTHTLSLLAVEHWRHEVTYFREGILLGGELRGGVTGCVTGVSAYLM